MLIDEKSNREKLGLQKEAIYHIIIRGKITATLMRVVENMQIRQDEEQEDVVNLVGYLPDQSALLGLLNALDDVRHEILSVRILSSN
jgi:hypothetical protein